MAIRLSLPHFLLSRIVLRSLSLLSHSFTPINLLRLSSRTSLRFGLVRRRFHSFPCLQSAQSSSWLGRNSTSLLHGTSLSIFPSLNSHSQLKSESTFEETLSRLKVRKERSKVQQREISNQQLAIDCVVSLARLDRSSAKCSQPMEKPSSKRSASITIFKTAMIPIWSRVCSA